jgi:hypothetical protein
VLLGVCLVLHNKIFSSSTETVLYRGWNFGLGCLLGFIASTLLMIGLTELYNYGPRHRDTIQTTK